MNEAQVRLCREIGKGGTYASDFILAGERRLRGESRIHEPGFDRPSAALAPEGGGHFLDEGELNFIARVEVVQIPAEGILKALPGFVLQHDTSGEQSMAQRIRGGTNFSRRRFRAPRPGAVSAGSEGPSQ
jgi:hypothetical protein